MDWIDEIARAWRREYPELDSSAMPPLVRLARLAVLLERFQRAVLEPFELSASDYSVLAMLRRAGKPYRASPSLLVSRLQHSSGGLTKMLKRLEERGLVGRVPDPDDGRGLLVSLTPAGLRVQESVFNAFLAASNDLLGSLPRREKRDLDTLLRALLDRFEDYLGDGGSAE
ncbi:MAG: MarR family transcriptional regulator [Myxococcota bacterium]